MHNLYAIFGKIIDICKQYSSDLVKSKGNIPLCGVVPHFSDLEVIALSLTAVSISIDGENYLFSKLQEYKSKFSYLISRRQYNDRRRNLRNLCNSIRERIAIRLDGDENYLCIDSKPIEVCRIARSKRCKLGKRIIPSHRTMDIVPHRGCIITDTNFMLYVDCPE